MIGTWRRWRARNPGASMVRIVIWDLIRYILSPIFFLLYGLRGFGHRNVPDEGPVLLVCNHQSYFDLVALGLTLDQRHFHAMARRTLFRGPFGGLIRALNAFEVDQERGDIRAIRTAIDLLKRGYLVLIFPEGSRTPDGAMHAFQEGVMLLIRRAKPTVVPAAIEGVYDAWPIWSKRPRLGSRMGVQYGEPIAAERLLEMKPHEAMDHLQRVIDSMRKELGAKIGHSTISTGAGVCARRDR